MIQRSQEGKYECLTCGKQFATKQKVTRHAEIHLDCYHTCPTCGKVVKTRNALEIHNRTYHGSSANIHY